MLSHVWLKKMDPSGGRIFWGYTFSSEKSPYVCREKETPSVSGMTYSMEDFALTCILRLLEYSKDPKSLSGRWETPTIPMIVSDCLCLGRHTMSSLKYKWIDIPTWHDNGWKIQVDVCMGTSRLFIKQILSAPLQKPATQWFGDLDMENKMCTQNRKPFAWLMVNDRLKTRNILRRRKKFLEEGYNCVLCQEELEETLEHLFFDCSSAACRWFALGIVWNGNVNIHDKIYLAKQEFMQPFFMEIFLIGCWTIWNERNNLIFNNRVPSVSTWKASFKAEVRNHFFRINQRLHQSITHWLQAL